MLKRLQAVMELRSKLVIEGRFEELAEHYVYPATLMIGKSEHTLRCRSHAAHLFAEFQQSRRAEGVVSQDVRVIAVELPIQGHFRVWVRKRDMNADGVMISSRNILHHCVQTSAGILTERTDFRGWTGLRYGFLKKYL